MLETSIYLGGLLPAPCTCKRWLCFFAWNCFFQQFPLNEKPSVNYILTEALHSLKVSQSVLMPDTDDLSVLGSTGICHWEIT